MNSATQSIRSFEDRLYTHGDGLTIAAADWPGIKGPLICVHGLTSSSRVFAGMASELPDHRILAVDCRGRGESSKDVAYGIDNHVKDLAAVFEQEGIDKATLVGHSMGAYIVAAFCAKYPQRVEQMVFIDGGYFLEFPKNVTPDELLDSMLGTFLTKLHRTWESTEEYLAFYEGTDLYPNGIDQYGRTHFEYDLAAGDPPLSAKIDVDCVAPDWRDVLDYEAVSARLRTVRVPLTLIRAPDGLTGTGDEVIPDAVRDKIVALVPATNVIDAEGTNHHTILCSEYGARAVADVIRSLEG